MEEPESGTTCQSGCEGGLLRIYNKDGKSVAGIYADPGWSGLRIDNGALRIDNKDGKSVAVIRANVYGDGLMWTSDSNGVVTSQTH